MWTMDDWQFLERHVVTDPKGRRWTLALMDVLGQEGDPDVPGRVLEAQYAQGRYFTLIYSSRGAVQWERGHATLAAARAEYDRLLDDLEDGRLDPAQPIFRPTLED